MYVCMYVCMYVYIAEPNRAKLGAPLNLDTIPINMTNLTLTPASLDHNKLMVNR